MRYSTFLPARLFVVLCLSALFLLPAIPVNAETNRSCFAETGQCISGRIREYWWQNGGLPVFGYPLNAQHEEQVEGKPVQVQWFERNRLELHPENKAPYDVLLGRLGVDRLQQQTRDWNSFTKTQSAKPGCLFFAETGHNLCEPFLSYFTGHGLEFDGNSVKSLAESIALFGYPLSEQQVEASSDGKSYTVQWFERARFEYHPENQAPYNVLLGLLGEEVSGLTPKPGPVPLDLDGYWKGSFSNSSIAFGVVNSQVVFITSSLNGDNCSSINYLYGLPGNTIADNAFASTKDYWYGTYKVTGKFTSGSSATGTWSSNGNYEANCFKNWEAQKFNPPAGSYDGLWYGTTSQGDAFLFTVDNNAVSYRYYTYQLPGCTYTEMGGGFLNSHPVNNSSFAFNEKGNISTENIQGRFSAANSATGQVSLTRTDCNQSLNLSWQAARV